jgi:fructokinase
VRIGVDLGGTKIEVVAFAADGRELWRRRAPTPKSDYDGIVSVIAGLVQDAEHETGKKGTVGIGIPGTISPKTGLIKGANTTSLIGHALDRDLTQRLDRPVRLANDANCFALSEATDGAAIGETGVFGVILGTGVGGGLIFNGSIIVGTNAIAGEWGHNPLPWPRTWTLRGNKTLDERPGVRCYCGRSGCIETFLSGTGFAREHLEVTGRSLSATDIVAAAKAGDADAAESFERYLDRLARALATVINLFDPDVIVLGGGLSKIQDLYEAVPKRWGAWVFSDYVATRLVPPRFGDTSGVRGAAWLWPENAPELSTSASAKPRVGPGAT